MFAGGWKRNRRPIGIDFGSHSIKMLQLEPACTPSGGWVAVAAAECLSDNALPAVGPDRAAVVSAHIKEALSQNNFVGRSVVVGLPADAVEYKNLRVPAVSTEQLPTVIEQEASQRHYFEPSVQQWRYLVAGDVEQGDERRKEVLLVAADCNVIEQYLKILDDNHLEPAAMTVSAEALARCFDEGAQETQDNHVRSNTARVIVDMGASGARVLILSGQRIAFLKTIQIGGRRLDEEAARQLNVSQAEARRMRHGGETPGAVIDAIRDLAQDAARELQLCLRYYSVTFRGRKPESVQFVGGESRDASLATLLSQGAGVMVQPVSPLARIDLSRLTDKQIKASMTAAPGAWAVAAGLSMGPSNSMQSNRRTPQETAA